MRDYSITRGSLGYHICRMREENWVEMKEWLQNNSRTRNKGFARTFYHLSDATSALVLVRIRWKKETPTTSIRKSEFEDGKEKRSWHEL